jgi:hypothetical protein
MGRVHACVGVGGAVAQKLEESEVVLRRGRLGEYLVQIILGGKTPGE